MCRRSGSGSVPVCTSERNQIANAICNGAAGPGQKSDNQSTLKGRSAESNGGNQPNKMAIAAMGQRALVNKQDGVITRDS